MRGPRLRPPLSSVGVCAASSNWSAGKGELSDAGDAARDAGAGVLLELEGGAETPRSGAVTTATARLLPARPARALDASSGAWRGCGAGSSSDVR